MKVRSLVILCLVMTFGVFRAAANARQGDGPLSQPASATIYMPLVANPPTIDLTIARLEVSQAVQTPGQSVPLVADRPTLVRAYLQATAPQAIRGVTLSFAATLGETPLDGSPLNVEPVTAPLAPAQEVYTSTVNVSLPAAWRSGNVTLTVTVDPSDAINETNEANNQRSASLAFNPVPPLELIIVPINYSDTRWGIYHPAVSIDPVSDFVKRTFPLSAINVTYHSLPIDFEGDLSQINGWTQLLDQITDIKYSEYLGGTPLSKVYYGLVPPSYFPPYYRGIGWIGYRAAVGVGFDTIVGAHEIGHTFNRLHAPCGKPLDPDPSYPYPNASIGYYGIDVYSNLLVSPDYPNFAKDLMSYCSPQWISDYTYVGLYNDQLSNGVVRTRSAPTQVLLIRVRSDGQQAAEMLPVYSLEGFSDYGQVDSDDAVELIGREGEVIATYPVRRYETADLNPPAYAIYAAVPQPAKPISKIRLVHAGTPQAERLMKDRLPVQPTVLVPQVSDNAVSLAWGEAETPALVRYTAGSSEAWTTLDVDILGGELSIDRSRLPGGDVHFEVIPADASTPIHFTLDLLAGR